MIADIDIDDLPGILQELVDQIGVSETLALVERFGGTRLYVPVKYDPLSELIGIIGHKAAASLVQYAAGDVFDLPKGDAAIRAVRNRRILEKWQSGDRTQRQLAIEYHLTERQIRTICAGLDDSDDRQQSLF